MKHILVLIFFALASCDYATFNNTEMGPPSGEGSIGSEGEQNGGVECAPDQVVDPSVASEVLDYQKIKVQLFDAHCVRCHNPGRPSAGIDLSSYNSVKARLREIDFAVTRNIMPPAGPLDPVLKGHLSDWIKAGAPEKISTEVCKPTVGDNTNPVPPVVDVDPAPSVPTLLTEMPQDSEINFSLIKDRIFSFYCLTCHSSAGGPRGGLNLENYADVIDELDDLEEVLHEGSMPPPPRPSISALEKSVILKWIKLGAPQ